MPVTIPSRRPSALIAALVAFLPGAAARADTTTRGSLTLDARGFVPDAFEETEDYGVAVTSAIDIKSDIAPWQLAVRGFARADAFDETRQIVVVEEAYVAFAKDPIAFAVGPQIVNWTATEAFHPADVINSRNLDSDLENFEKFGEPMAQLRVRVLDGYASAYYMPMRIATHLPPDTSRLSLLPVTVDLGDALWMDREGRPSESLFAHQAALRLSQTFGPADVAAHFVHHNDRLLPTITVDPDSGDLRPTFHTVDQVGLTYVHVIGGLILKLESAYVRYVEPAVDYVEDPVDHGQVAAGLEYGWTTGAGHDATVIAEGQVAESPGGDEPSAFLLFQRGVLVGYSHFFNDEAARRLTLTFITDAATPYEYVAAASYQQRLADEWTIDAVARTIRLSDFGATSDTNQIHLIATLGELRLTRHF